MAVDAATGEVAWTFFVIPRPGEFGHDTWPQDSDIWEVGGGGVWLVGTVDPGLGLVYFATGNPVPMFGGEIREGDNLFSAAVLALDMETGERRWHFQVVRHDIWDADIATPMLLYDVEMDGRMRKGVAAIRADGYLFLFDRETGEPLIPIEQRPVPQDPGQRTADTQPFPVGAERIIPDCSFWRDRVPPPFELSCSFFTPPTVDQQHVVALGSPIPMVRVTPMSFSPQTGLIYAQGRESRGSSPSGSRIRGSRTTARAAICGSVFPSRPGRWPPSTRAPTPWPGGRSWRAGGWPRAVRCRRPAGWCSGARPTASSTPMTPATGERLWAFQATPAGLRMRPGTGVHLRDRRAAVRGPADGERALGVRARR